MNFEELKKFYNGKRVLLTGHTGFKGSWLSKILIMCGAKLTGYALNPPTDTNIFDILGLDTEMNSVIGDIRDLEHLKKVFDEVEPEYVIHMAAQPIVRDSYDRPVYTYETNVMGTVNIMECVRLSKSVKSFLNVWPKFARTKTSNASSGRACTGTSRASNFTKRWVRKTSPSSGETTAWTVKI